MNSMVTQINEIIKDSLGVEHVNINERVVLDEMGIDSIEKAEILVKIQKAFSLKLNLDEFQSLLTMSEIYQYVGNKLQ